MTFEVWNCKSYKFVLLRDSFDVLSLLWFHKSFRITISECAQKAFGSLTGITFNLSITSESIIFLMTYLGLYFFPAMFYTFQHTSLALLWLNIFLFLTGFAAILNGIVFIISFSNYSGWWIEIKFIFVCWSYSSLTFLNLLINLNSLMGDYLGLSIYKTVSSINTGVYFFFPYMDTFISLSCLIPLAKAFNTILNSSGQRGHFCFILDLSRNLIVLHH